ncbi:hypothetical protein ASPZODRAFT_136073 [Penicilliopsis zonata CBS 506.65]|uniref:Uncharacterized protein n=1 Tax=Penicilliopsis zonata CBS 506.65 TaxID=1073090 RepID=A0A1L9S8W9_9EURO|nr:hypothetical protein ASPZODRAFT_136073 [Penicilliopsis zonata CBS 506.65]OJJ43622.1 hypothetical protein ASPZODRAFT_136073 [Penicilliopsis zonata CBS 506.65]
MSRASTIGGGDGVIVTSTTEAYIIEYQPVTAHGNAAVSDANSKTAVSYLPGQAVLKPAAFDQNVASTKQGVVHVPIPNPPSLTKSATLQNILLDLNSANDARVNAVSLYYDKHLVVKTDTSNTSTFHIDFITAEAASYAYRPPTGICVSLDLRFPNSDSSIDLYSVSLIYKAA